MLRTILENKISTEQYLNKLKEMQITIDTLTLDNKTQINLQK